MFSGNGLFEVVAVVFDIFKLWRISATQLCSLIGRRLRERFVSAKHHLPFNLRRLRTTETVCRGQSMSCHLKPKYSLGRIPVATATASAGPCGVASAAGEIPELAPQSALAFRVSAAA